MERAGNDDDSGYMPRGDHNFLHWRFPLFVHRIVSNLRHESSLCIHSAWAVRPDHLCPYSGTESNAMTGQHVVASVPPSYMLAEF